jgi:hypothetical protein
MKRYQEIEMQAEISRQLFADGVSEFDAYVQLKSDARFSHVNRNTIRSVYHEERKKIVKEYSVNSVKYEYSSITVDSKDAVQDHGLGNGERFFDKVSMLNEHFAVILHAISKDENGKVDKEFHHLTLIDLFNNFVKYVFKREN